MINDDGAKNLPFFQFLSTICLLPCLSMFEFRGSQDRQVTGPAEAFGGSKTTSKPVRTERGAVSVMCGSCGELWDAELRPTQELSVGSSRMQAISRRSIYLDT